MTAIDPVCGMEVEEESAEWKTIYQGQTYYFCAQSCLRSFEKEPGKYLQTGGQREPRMGHEHGHDPQDHEPGRMAGDR